MKECTCQKCGEPITVTNEEICHNASVFCKNGHYFEALKLTKMKWEPTYEEALETVKRAVNPGTTVLEDILAIQAEDNPVDEGVVNIDIACNHRGAASGMNYTFGEIAKHLGMESNKYPESNAKDLCNRALTKMVQHYIFMLISEAAMKHGFSEDDAIDFAAVSYQREKHIGRSDSTILKGWL